MSKFSHLDERMGSIVASNTMLKMGWANYPLINYPMLQIWINELLEIGGSVKEGMTMAGAHRLIELSYLCGIPVPGTYVDPKTGEIKNDEVLGMIEDQWKIV
jgi:hypothetical protein